MSIWPNWEASGGPCVGLDEGESQNPSSNLIVRPTGSDSSQQASSKPGAVQFGSLKVERLHGLRFKTRRPRLRQFIKRKALTPSIKSST